MAENPKDYRDPKVTNTTGRSRSATTWIWIAVAVIVVLLILAWIFGWFGGAEQPVVLEGAMLEQPAPVVLSTTTIPA